MTALPTVTRTVSRITARTVVDDDPDVSWMYPGGGGWYESNPTESDKVIAAYEAGEFWFVGVVVTARDERDGDLASASLWGIESNAPTRYLHEVAEDLVSELEADLGVRLAAVPRDYSAVNGDD